MSNVVLLAPPKILLQNQPQQWLEALGRGSVIFTCASQRAKLEAYFGGCIELVFFERFNENHLVEKRALEVMRNIQAVDIIALAEIDLLRAARVRDKLGLSESDEEKLEYFRDKFKMKHRAAECGLPVASMRMVRSALSLLDFVEQVGYPLVVKPVDGRGSNGVAILRDDAELEHFLESDGFNIYGDMLAEAFVGGEMYQANGFYRDGKLICMSVVKCVNSCFEFLNGKSLGLQMLSEDNLLRTKIVNYAVHLITEVLPAPKDTLFHLEIFVDDQDNITLCEIGARLGGCVVNEEIYAAYGIDFRLELIKSMRDREYQVQGDFSQYNRLIGQINIPPQTGKLISIEQQCPFDWVVMYRINGNVGTVYSSMSFTNAEIVNILVEGDSEQQIRERFVAVESWFREITKYQAIEEV